MSELYDPYDYATQENPYPAYEALREEHPVYRNEERGFWALSRFEDVRAAVNDHQRFSSAQGILIGQDLMASAGALMPMLVTMDPPRHNELRKLVSRGFTPRRMAAMADSVRAIARTLLDGFLERGACDLVQEYAAPLPAIIIAEMLGVPTEDRAQFRSWSDRLIQGNPDDPESIQDLVGAATELYSYFIPMLDARRTEPRDDLMSALLAAEVDGQHLSDEELLGFCFLLLVAGNETTTNLISNAAVILHERPDVRRHLAEHPESLDIAVEEFLRLESPVQGLARTLTADVQMHGTTMRAGDKVMLLFASANRDPREFERPEEFIVDRRTDRQLPFGHGIHFCLGASLARLECRIAYEELLARMPAYHLQPGARRVHSGPIRGFLQLPITFEAVTAAPV
jgi:cytochrome P450